MTIAVSKPIAEALNCGDLLGPPAIISGEDPKEYAELLERLYNDVKPRDFIEAAFVRDIADHIWEIRRLRRLKAGLLKAVAHKGLEQILQPLVGWPQSGEVAKKWVQRVPDTLKQVDAVLAQAGLGMTEVMAEAFSLNLASFATFDSLIERSEKRYASALHEIAHHREALAEAVQATKEAVDAEYEDILPKGAGNGATP